MLKVVAFLALLASCSAANICSPPCGCFSDAPPFDDRPLPETHEQQNLRYLLYTPSASAIPIRWDNIPPQWSSGRDTIFMIHGWNSSPSTWNGVRAAFFAASHNVNVITVDWSTGAGNIFYPQPASNTRVVGACSGHLAQTLASRGQSLARMTCLGHSLGAHACGYMGRHTSGNLGRVSGLDPAGPWFTTRPAQVRVDRSDARFVDLMHTNGGVLGTGAAHGHVDFFPNKGIDMPGCGSSACDHSICRDFYEQSIRRADICNFEARPCNSDGDADAGRCEDCRGGCSRMGYYANTRPARGTMFLRTRASAPYCED